MIRGSLTRKIAWRAYSCAGLVLISTLFAGEIREEAPFNKGEAVSDSSDFDDGFVVAFFLSDARRLKSASHLGR